MLQPMESRGVGHDLATEQQQHKWTHRVYASLCLDPFLEHNDSLDLSTFLYVSNSFLFIVMRYSIVQICHGLLIDTL